jgi:hypothetical protein
MEHQSLPQGYQQLRLKTLITPFPMQEATLTVVKETSSFCQRDPVFLTTRAAQFNLTQRVGPRM